MVFSAYPGHFPGNPVVPGAALLEAVADEAARRGWKLVRVERARFLSPARPGEEIQFRIAPDGARSRFSAWRGEVEILRGIGHMEAGPSGSD